MDATSRLQWRMAQRIRSQLADLHRKRQQASLEQLEYVREQMRRFEQLGRRLDQANRRGWLGAARRLRRRLTPTASEIADLMSSLPGQLDRGTPRDLPGMRELLAELDQLEDEFGIVGFGPRGWTISVTTESIVLEEVSLGPFEIRLHLDELAKLGGTAPYQVLALEPNPPMGSDHVTHPHVSDDRLCEGEAAPAIRFALERGALSEFFLLVRAVLSTYNAGSPYVALDEWHGVSCRDCGDRIDSEDASSCHRCGDDLCGSCSSRCECCDESFCDNCGGACAACHEPTCDRCLKRCSGCGQAVCTDCLETDQRCPDCRAEDEDEQNDHDEHEEIDHEEQEQGTVPVPPAPAPAVSPASSPTGEAA